jgi:ribosomal protein S18 acetylase RimI-like enzyme
MTRLVEWDRELLAQRRDDVLDVYAAAMAVPRAAARGRRSVVASHLDRDGLRAVAAVDDDGALVGVAYGYLGRAGQWWHDQVRDALVAVTGPVAADGWLAGSFEVCELHVLPDRQGEGLGRELLAALLAGTPARTALLTTPDTETRAREFYRAGGWVDLVRALRFPGDPRSFAVLGLRLDGHDG